VAKSASKKTIAAKKSVGKIAQVKSGSVKSAPLKPDKKSPVIVKSGKSAVERSAPVQVKPEYSPPIQAPVATNLKPRKNLAGISPRDLEHYRDLLLEKRRELVGDMHSMEGEALRTNGGSNLSTLPMHMADLGTDNYEQEFTLGLVEKERNLLREINDALAKIQNGSFGLCEGTGKPISKPRLEAQPWARFSIEHARQMEKNGMGVR
jgi:RNA polymerase-binding protein DksA